MSQEQEFRHSRILLASEIVGRAFTMKEAQDLSEDDLMELASLLADVTLRKDAEGA